MSVILLASIFNWKIAIAYVIVGIILAVIVTIGILIIGHTFNSFAYLFL